MEHVTHQSRLSDRQARALIVAAEARGFEREPDLPERVRDADLHFDAVAALEYLFVRDPAAIVACSTVPDPISPDIGARRIVNGRVTAADAEVLIDAARARGCSPTGCDLPLTEYGQLFAKAEEAVAFWAEDPDELVRMLGDGCRLSPLPRSEDET